MKELILFSFVVLFIACQNQPIPETKLESQSPAPVVSTSSASLESFACQLSSQDPQESVDVTKELGDPTEPGFHYRETTLRSETLQDGSHSDLICVSQVSNSSEVESSQAETPTAVQPTPDPSLATWNTLTHKWTYVAKKQACEDLNAQSVNPSCQDISFLIENGKLFSSPSEDPIASL